MSLNKHSIAVLGAGSWGTALAVHLCRAGHRVAIWDRNAEQLKEIASRGVNSKYYPDDKLPSELRVALELSSAIADTDTLVFAVPSSAMREVARACAATGKSSALLISTAKGLEKNSYQRMSDVLAAELGDEERICVLSGPSFALEVLREMPTAVVIAGQSEPHTKQAAEIFHNRFFRVYTSSDVVGVELGGAVKNVIALAAGVVDGMDMGNNARAALITRGIAEMQRLTVALGGRAETVSGLSGLGDLLLTATGDLSRNRRVGLGLGAGRGLDEILAGLGQVAEAVTAAGSLYQLACARGISVPIIEQVYSLLSGKTTAAQAGAALLSREQTSEH